MNLELKHLAPYLPYELKIFDNSKSKKIIENKNNDFLFENLPDEYVSAFGRTGLEQVLRDDLLKPILRPIEDLSLLVIEEFEKYDGKRNGKANDEIINLFCEENGVDEIIENIVLSSLPYECIEFLFKNHYDFFDLISQGLAVSIHDVVQADA